VLTKLKVRNFKRFNDIEVELGSAVVFIGPNNCGKTTALQALTLWDIGLKRWLEKRGGRETPEKRPGVTINRNDLIAVPVPDAKSLWRELHVRDVRKVNGRQRTQNVRIDITVEGVTDGKAWVCGLEFDYANEESLYCRPLRVKKDGSKRLPVPDIGDRIRVAYLPPMSGLAAREHRKERGEINELIGEGRTAEVLRNLCYQLVSDEEGRKGWVDLVARIQALFGVTLCVPEVTERAEIVMRYEENRTRLDLSAAGRGLQQTLLLLAYLHANPGAVLLLDEPDAHLEMLRQRQIYQELTDTATQTGGQVIIASHSEVILREAAERDTVVAFIGKPHRIGDRGSQVLKSLAEIGFEDYILAEQLGWVLYLEGSTDLGILKAFATKIGHRAAPLLERAFVKYVRNNVGFAQSHFGGLCEAKPDLQGIGVFDRLDRVPPPSDQFRIVIWARCEIENYLCYPEVLIEYAAAGQVPDLFGLHEAECRKTLMERCIRDVVPPMAMRDRGNPWWVDEKVSDKFLDKAFAMFYEELGLPNQMPKTNYHRLVAFVPPEFVADEVREKLDAIVEVARQARPAMEME